MTSRATKDCALKDRSQPAVRRLVSGPPLGRGVRRETARRTEPHRSRGKRDGWTTPSSCEGSECRPAVHRRSFAADALTSPTSDDPPLRRARRRRSRPLRVPRRPGRLRPLMTTAPAATTRPRVLRPPMTAATRLPVPRRPGARGHRCNSTRRRRGRAPEATDFRGRRRRRGPAPSPPRFPDAGDGAAHDDSGSDDDMAPRRQRLRR
jgi:hypothetical protein